MSSTVDMKNEEAVPYTGPKPYGMSDDLIVPGALDLDCDERLWVPQSQDVEFRPLVLSASQG
ncbi:MAG: cupin, partial [Rhodococcus sp. (in: high G+C Gram-positive bacteria)]